MATIPRISNNPFEMHEVNYEGNNQEDDED